MLNFKLIRKCDYDVDSGEVIKSFTSNNPIPQKKRVLQFLNAFPDYAAGAGRVYDKISGTYTKIPIIAYAADGYIWDSADIYYFNNYNIQLSDDFIAHVLKQDEQ